MPGKRGVTRRRMLKGLAVGLGATTLSACRQPTPAPTPTTPPPTPTPAPTNTPQPTPRPTVALLTTDGELPTAERFFAYAFQEAMTPAGRAHFAVSFRYDDREAATILPDWQAEWTDAAPADGATRHTVTLTDPKTGLQCRCEVTTFADYPAVEWVAHFKNTGTTDTPIVADIQPLAVLFSVAQGETCTVHHAKGSDMKNDDFAPQETPLAPGDDLRLACLRGRSSDVTLPFFDVEAGERCVIGAIGWTGGWAATFQRGEEGIRVRAGMQETHLRLHAGEEIRTPRILLLFWQGERIGGHNLLRRFILAYHTPRPNGQLLQGPICDGVWGAQPTDQQLARIRWIKDANLPIEYFWVDAGWYGEQPYNSQDPLVGWFEQAGNWYPHKTLYPQGLKPLGDACKAAGLGFLVWMEPERVYLNTQWAREHAEWLLGPRDNIFLFNLGLPEARRFLTDFVSNWITENGITCYRQDFNMAPAPYWRAADAPDRIGMAEIRHIEGLYAFWDELLARHPGLIIDNCSSGGRRIDLETISRSIPLWRSDVQAVRSDPLAQQNQTAGLSWWVPLSTGSCQEVDSYVFRSALGPGIVVNWSTRWAASGTDSPAVKEGRALLEQLHIVRKYFYGDYYPLTPYSLLNNTWAVWQFDRPDLGEGLVLAIRRRPPEDRVTLPLRGLDPEKSYEVRSLENSTVTTISGKELTEKGLTIEIPFGPYSDLIVYKRIA
ncbi:MAG: alpha-galactosidase [Anaerolineae bacterium]|nr:alpha-galactosidase [Anaerolineae bacterium]